MVLLNKWRPDGVLCCGIVVIPSVSFKDQPLEVHLVMLNACLSHSWPDKSFRPRSRVAQLRPGTRAVKVRTLEAVRMCGEPMA